MTQTERDWKQYITFSKQEVAALYLSHLAASLQGVAERTPRTPLALEQPLDSSGPQGDEDSMHRCDQQHGLCSGSSTHTPWENASFLKTKLEY